SLLRAYFRLDGTIGVSARDRVADALGHDESERFMAPVLSLLGQPVEDSRWDELNTDQKRRQTLDAVKHLLTRTAAKQPVCVIVEDLHWADPETLGVLDSVTDGVAVSRIALIVSYRPEHQHEWGGKSCYGQIRLDTFSSTAAQPMLDALLGAAPDVVS